MRLSLRFRSVKFCTDQLNPKLEKSLECLKSSEVAIEEKYNSLITLLNREKEELLKTVKELRKEK